MAPFLGLGFILAAYERGHHYVLQGTELGQQMMELKHEAYVAVAKGGQGRLVHLENVAPPHHNPTRRGPIKGSQDM